MTRKRNLLTGMGFLLAVVAGLVVTGLPASAQTAPATKEQLETLIYSVKGPDLFRAHCAACHGFDAKGGGPMAAALKGKVPDLTVLAKNNKGMFLVIMPIAKIK